MWTSADIVWQHIGPYHHPASKKCAKHGTAMFAAHHSIPMARLTRLHSENSSDRYGYGVGLAHLPMGYPTPHPPRAEELARPAPPVVQLGRPAIVIAVLSLLRRWLARRRRRTWICRLCAANSCRAAEALAIWQRQAMCDRLPQLQAQDLDAVALAR